MTNVPQRINSLAEEMLSAIREGHHDNADVLHAALGAIVNAELISQLTRIADALDYIVEHGAVFPAKRPF